MTSFVHRSHLPFCLLCCWLIRRTTSIPLRFAELLCNLYAWSLRNKETEEVYEQTQSFRKYIQRDDIHHNSFQNAGHRQHALFALFLRRQKAVVYVLYCIVLPCIEIFIFVSGIILHPLPPLADKVRLKIWKSNVEGPLISSPDFVPRCCFDICHKGPPFPQVLLSANLKSLHKCSKFCQASLYSE